MTTQIDIGTTWRHKKEGYLVKVEDSEWHRSTKFRRMVPLNAKVGNPFRVKKTHYFLGEFEQTAPDGSVTTAEQDYINVLRAIANRDAGYELEDVRIKAREVLVKHKMY